MFDSLEHARAGRTFAKCARILALWLCVAALASSVASGQDTPPPPAPDIATLVADIKARLTGAEQGVFGDALDALVAVEESRRAAARDTLNPILADLKSIDAANATILDLDQRVANAPILLEQIKAELALPPPSVDPPADQTVQQLEQGVAQAEAELKTAKEDTASLEAEAKLRSQKREEIPTVIAQTRQEMQGVDDDIASRTTLGASDPASRVDLLRLTIHRRLLEQTIALREKEQQSIEARRDTLRARQDRAARRVTQAEQRVDAWLQKLNGAREAEARRVAAEAKKALRQSANEHEVIKELLRQRADLANRREALVSEHQRAQQDRRDLASTVQTTRQEFLRSFNDIERAGLTNSVGIVLSQRRKDLPVVRALAQEMRHRQQQLSAVLGQQFEDERARDNIKNIGVAVERIMESLESTVPQEQRDAIRDRAREELAALSDLLGTTIQTSVDLSEELSLADTAERDLVKVTEEYTAFIDARILWVRSTSPLSWDDLRSAGVDLSKFADRSLWEQTLSAIRGDMRRNPLPYLMLLLPVGAWLTLMMSGRRLARAREHLTEELTRDRLRPSFRPTLRAMLLLLVGSLRWPLLLLLVSLVFSVSADTPAAIQSIVGALRSVSAIWLALEIGRQACRGGGFAEIHLRWSRESVAAVRRNLFWLSCFVVPADTLFRIVDSDAEKLDLTSEPLARLTFILGMIVLAGFIQRTLRPHGTILRSYFDPIRGGWLDRLSGLWFLVLFFLPLFLGVLTGLGYFYSAKRLQEGLSQTLLLGLAVVIISALFYRWLWVTRRRVAIDQTLKRRATALGQAETKVETGADAPVIAEEEIDLPAANAQTLQLFHSAEMLTILLVLWGIWNPVLPALGLLDRFQLWPTFGPVEVVSQLPESLRDMDEGFAAAPVEVGATVPPAISTPLASSTPDTGVSKLPLPLGAAGSTGAGASDTLTAVHRVTIADLAMAIIIGVITLILTRNIPGLLEIAILQRLPLDAGSRYAISTIVRYVIVIVGVMVTFGAIGIGWSQIQWLAAALTFGLAFGLQEIFANFISGLIILVERPMRVGDTVTIGDISGEVSRIRMRATTITQWNRKELIVPNREFITGQLVNWTLSDPTLRLEIPIGIAYGSDTRLARSLLLKVANKCETVLRNPPPRALFLGFGDNSLSFELRVFISGISNYTDTLDFVHYGIDDEFRKAGIEISFPQRDIHIRTINGTLAIQQVERAADANAEK